MSLFELTCFEGVSESETGKSRVSSSRPPVDVQLVDVRASRLGKKLGSCAAILDITDSPTVERHNID